MRDVNKYWLQRNKYLRNFVPREHCFRVLCVSLERTCQLEETYERSLNWRYKRGCESRVVPLVARVAPAFYTVQGSCNDHICTHCLKPAVSFVSSIVTQERDDISQVTKDKT